MAGYQPYKITGNSTGLVQNREEFLLPDDAYPVLQNAYVWRERILRKKGYELLGRLRRNFTNIYYGFNNATFNNGNVLRVSGYVSNVTQALNGVVTTKYRHNLTTGDLVIFTGVGGMPLLNGVTITITVIDNTSFFTNVNTSAYPAYTGGGFFWSSRSSVATEPSATIVPGSFIIVQVSTGITFTDNGDGTLSSVTPGNTGFINYVTGAVGVTSTSPPGPYLYSGSLSYYPGMPVMGIRTRELQNSEVDQTVFFDQRYAYVYNSISEYFEEFIPGTSWNYRNGNITSTDFFWSTNYWVSSTTIPSTATPFFTTNNIKLFWVTNNTGQFKTDLDPIRITDGSTWVDFSPPNFGQINATDYLIQCLAMIPFRGRMLAFNTWEGTSSATIVNYTNRIRWSTIGNPFIPYAAGPPATGSWRDDIRGQGGYLDIPTSEDIVSIGFVRDNLVIYCECSTWQLRYTGNSISPFQIEKVNSEIGSEGPFSSIQFDTSLVTIGDKGIIECDSYKSEHIDIKIPDFVFKFQNQNNGPYRVHGVRDFINRLAFWTVPVVVDPNTIFPSQRLVYNYENDSWALFNDSLTTLGTFQPSTSRTWLNTPISWIECDFPWIDNQSAADPSIVGGNQQGFIEYLDELTTNDVSLHIFSITGNTTTATVITCPSHNMQTGFVIEISGIPTGTPFENLNNGVFGIYVLSIDTLALYRYNSNTQEFDIPQTDSPATYVGGGLIKIRENFSVTSKKFNFIDDGQSIQLGFIDVLMKASDDDNPGAISLKVYLDYNDIEASNTLPRNQINDYPNVSNPDTFFNSVIPTTSSTLNGVGGIKFWQRVFCATRANFLTLQYTFSNAQLAGDEQKTSVQIDAQILWIRKAGRITQI